MDYTQIRISTSFSSEREIFFEICFLDAWYFTKRINRPFDKIGQKKIDPFLDPRAVTVQARFGPNFGVIRVTFWFKCSLSNARLALLIDPWTWLVVALKGKKCAKKTKLIWAKIGCARNANFARNAAFHRNSSFMGVCQKTSRSNHPLPGNLLKTISPLKMPILKSHSKMDCEGGWSLWKNIVAWREKEQEIPSVEENNVIKWKNVPGAGKISVKIVGRVSLWFCHTLT